MKRGAIVTGALIAAATSALAQPPAAVHTFVPGSGQTVGQEPEYYPANVLGLPDTTARRNVPATDPHQILSLGYGGEIVLRFAEPIVDGPGPDFTVFENAFYYTLGGREKIYAEPAEVSVSRNGVSFAAYSYDPQTLEGLAGTRPTYGDQNPYDPRVSGGNSFDLAELGIDSVLYIKIRDVVSIIVNNVSHPYWDPTLSGFDLDAVLALPLAGRSGVTVASGASIAAPQLTPNPAATHLAVTTGDARSLRLIDVHGRVLRDVACEIGQRSVVLDVRELAVGAYVVEVIDRRGVRSAALLRVMR
jgi:hypothetical protein